MDDFGKGTDKVSGALEGHKLSLGRVERALASYVGHAAGANAVTESLSVAFGSFAVGGGVIAGLLIGVGAVVAIYDKLTEGSKKAREEADKLTKSLNDQADARFRATEAGGRATVQETATNLANVQKETGAGLLSMLLQGMAPGGQSAGALTSGDAAAKVERLGKAASASQEAINQLGLTIAKQNDETARKTKEMADAEIAAAAKLDAEFQKRIDTLSKGLVFEDQRKAVTAQLVAIEHELESEVRSGTLTLEKRIIAMGRLGQVMDALSQKFIVAQKFTDVGQLVGIVGTGETAVARAHEAFGGPMAGVKTNAANGLITQPGQADLIGAQQVLNVKNLENADKNALRVSEAVWGAAIQGAQIIVNALNIGGGGKGSALGGALGSVGGMALGAILAPAGPVGLMVGSAIGSLVGNVAGSLIGGLFDSHKKAVDSNTQAVRALTSAMIQFAPTGFKIDPYRYAATDVKGVMRDFSRFKTRGGVVSFGT